MIWNVNHDQIEKRKRNSKEIINLLTMETT